MFTNIIITTLVFIGTIIDYILYIIRWVMWKTIQWVVGEDILMLGYLNDFKTFAQHFNELFGKGS